MKIESLITSEELKTARVSQAYFGRVVGDKQNACITVGKGRIDSRRR